MKLYIRYDINTVCKKVLQEQLDKLELDYSITGFGEVDLTTVISTEKFNELNSGLKNYGIQIVESYKSVLIQKIKVVVREIVYTDEKLPNTKTSAWLTSKLNHPYAYLSNLFSDITYTTIENFIILQKIERAKELIITNELNFSEIAWKLNYSSVGHFSNQFKNVTGLTPTSFQKIINKRNHLTDKEK